MEKLKKRYIWADKIKDCVIIILVLLWMPAVVMHCIGSFGIEGWILLIQSGLLVICSSLGIVRKKILKLFFLKGCETGEDVFEQYGVQLKYSKKIEDSLPEIESITFHRKWYAYTIKVHYTNYGIREIFLDDINLNNLKEYIVFD